MGNIYAKIEEDYQDYIRLCKLTNSRAIEFSNSWYEHLRKLKSLPNIEWKNYRYQLKE